MASRTRQPIERGKRGGEEGEEEREKSGERRAEGKRKGERRGERERGRRGGSCESQLNFSARWYASSYRKHKVDWGRRKG